MANGQQDPRDLDEVWNDFMEARTKLLQSMLDFVHAAQKAFDGHIWIAFGYPEGMKGWAAYCRNNFSQQASIMRQLPKSDRRQLLLEAKSAGFSDRTVDQIFDVSEKKNLPVTGVLGICAFIIWILLDTIGWMCSHRRMTCYWHGRDIGGPITWLWRLNAGIMPSNTIVFIITRTIVFLMMWTAIILSLWRWACPPLASMHFLTS